MPGVEFGRFRCFFQYFQYSWGSDFPIKSISFAILKWNWRLFLCINYLYRLIFSQYVSRSLGVFRDFPSSCSEAFARLHSLSNHLFLGNPVCPRLLLFLKSTFIQGNIMSKKASVSTSTPRHVVFIMLTKFQEHMNLLYDTMIHSICAVSYDPGHNVLSMFYGYHSAIVCSYHWSFLCQILKHNDRKSYMCLQPQNNWFVAWHVGRIWRNLSRWPRLAVDTYISLYLLFDRS